MNIFSFVEGYNNATNGDLALYDPQGVFFMNIGLISDFSAFIYTFTLRLLKPKEKAVG